jgi:hypothetical protein
MTEHFALDDLRPRTWLDAFPWLRGVASAPSGVPWWDEAIDDAGTKQRRQRLAQISELAMERLTRWTIGQIYPGLSPNLALVELQLPVRAINALGNRECNYAGDLDGITLDEIMGWRSVGVGTVDSILQALADSSTSVATPSVLSGGVADAQPAAELDATRLPSWLAALVDDVSQIATWFATVGLPSQPVFATELPPGTPAEIVKARQRLDALAADDVLEQAELELDAAGMFDDAIGALDPRAAEILALRLFADQPETLDLLGKRYAVTRERVRQIEGKARGAMLGFLGEGSPLESVALAARSLIGTVRPLDDLLALMPALANTVTTVEQPAWRVLDRLDDAYEIKDGWCFVPTLDAAQSATQTGLQEQSDQYGVARIDDIDLVECSRPDRLADLTKAWLEYCGYTVYGEHVFTRTQSVGDYAASILSVTGSPLSAQEIIDQFAFERSAGSLKNAMSIDDRFERVDRDRWALTEWGMDAYAGVRSVIRQQIAECGGRVKLDDLVEHITGKYTVTASSVVAYATAPPFEAREGIVRLAGTDREVRKSPERTRRLYRRGSAWAYRVRITTDHQRGSGSVAPVAIASILNLQFGENRQLESPLGPQSVNWTGIQPSFGTIRRFLMDGDIAADTEAFLVIRDDGTFGFEPVPTLSGEPLRDALTMVGASPTLLGEAARDALISAIGLPAGSPVASIIGGYRERGDSDIADLLLSVRDALEGGGPAERAVRSADIDDILELL